jgi:CubicO group peptidase (beta-lactamase class C family)
MFAQSGGQSPAEQKARALIQVISSGNPGEIREFVKANYSDEFLKIPLDAHVGFILSRHDVTRGYDIQGVQESTPNSVTMLIRSKLTGEWEAMYVGVEDKAPFKITTVGGRRPKVPAEAANAKKLSDKEIDREMKAFMKKLADADVFSGAVLLAKDGKPVYEGVFGTANKDFNVPNKLDTKFNLGSMNKMFTAVAIAQLVEKGKLSFEDPLSKFIPDFPDAESAKKIKIKNLLSHTAGLGGYFSKRWRDTSRGNIRTIDDMIAIARQDEKPQFEPGTKWQYSNTGMLIVGKVIEIVSGQSYYDYVRENIYKPAGMTNTDCYELDKVNTNLAVGYDKQFSDTGVTFANNIFSHVMRGGPQGGGYSTVEDLLKFDQALRSGKLISAEMFKTLTTAKPELNSSEYGFGFQVNPELKSAGHSGGFTGINSKMTMYLGSGWTAIVMSNYSGAAVPVVEKMESLINSSTSGQTVSVK